MLDGKMITRLKDEQAAVRDLLKGPEWAVWVKFLKKRTITLQGKVNKSVQSGDIIQAQCALTLLKDCKHQIESFVGIIQELEGQIKGGR